MKNKLLKFLVLVLCVSMALFVSACKSGDSDKKLIGCKKNRGESESLLEKESNSQSKYESLYSSAQSSPSESETSSVSESRVESGNSTPKESESEKESVSGSESESEKESVSELESESEKESDSESESESTHTCDFSELKYNTTHHWYECTCGAKGGETAHSGGSATCKELAECSICGQRYGELGNHEGGTATCTAKAVCSTCGQEYGSTLNHEYTELKYNETHHWYECVCGLKNGASEQVHLGGSATCVKKATCEVCNVSYGSFDEHNIVEGKCTSCGKEESQGLIYELSEDSTYYTVINIGSCEDFDLVIPAMYNGLPVKNIGYQAFYKCSILTSIEIPDSIVSIGDAAFDGCSNLTSVYIREIESWCSITFSDSSSNPLCYAKNLYINNEIVTELVIPDTITEIKNYVFYNCSRLASIEISDSVLSIGELAFYNCTSLTRVVIGENVKNIKGGAFLGCSSLTSVVIPNSVTGIGANVFGGCSSLTSVEIGDSVTSIGSFAFGNCSSLTSIVIPDSVTTIAQYALYGCVNLAEITLPFVGGRKTATSASSSTLFGYIFGSIEFSDVVETKQYYSQKSYSTYYIPSTIKKVTITGGNIFYGAFYNCKNLISIEIPDSVTTIGDYAFSYCDSLTSIEIPESVTAIGDSAFRGCSSLTSIEIPDSVTTIGNCAFYECSSLTSVVIGDSVETIGKSAFYNCYGLMSVVVPASVESIGESAFKYCYKLVEVINKSSHITVVKGSTGLGYIGYYALSVFNSGDTYVNLFTNDNGYIIYDGEEKILVRYEGSQTDLVLPNYITQIYKYAFYNSKSLTSVVIGDSVTRIGEHAFYCCVSLTNIKISEGVTIIGASAFAGCFNLTNIDIPDSLIAIGDRAFAGCVSLTSIEIPYNVTAIDTEAFNGCESLTSVYYKGTSENWNNITIASYGNDYLQNATRYYYIENGADVPNDSVNYWAYDEDYVIGYLNDERILLSYIGIETELVLPNYITQINHYAFYKCASLTSVVIGDNVETIGDYAFSDCSSLTSVVIPDSVTTIGDRAFYNCYNLTSVEIGDSVTTIGDHAFRYCYKLVEVINNSTHITVTKGSSSNGYVGYYVLSVSNCDSTYASKLTNDNGYIVYTEGSKKILVGYSGTETDLVIPDYITEINQYAFYYCTSLTSVVIGDSVTTIGCQAFDGTAYYNNDSNWENNVLYIGKYLIKAVTSIVGTYEIKDGTLSIAESAFSGCDSLTSVVIPDSVTTIGSGAFENCSSLTSVVIGNGVTTLPEGLFRGCSNLQSITLPFVGGSKNATTASASTLFGYIFGTSSYTGSTEVKQYYASGTYDYTTYYIPALLKKVTITGGEVLYGAFYNCSSLTSVVIGDGVTTIGSSAFYNCNSLTSIEIPNSVETIGNSAFNGCSSLTSVVIGDGVTTIGNYAFSSCNSLTSIEIPNSVETIGDYAFSYCSSLTSVEMGDSVTTIGDYAFRNCTSLTCVEIGDRVETIGFRAFEYCSSLTSVVIGESVEIIGENAFAYCSSLTSVYYAGDIEGWCNITFSDNSSNLLYYAKNLYIDNELVTELVIPNTVTEIKAYAFQNCLSLTSVVIGDSVTTIGLSAFNGCINLAEITLPFVGNTKDGTTNTHFGYIFGASSYFYNNEYVPTSLKKVAITSATIIGKNAFYGCDNLTSVEIPDSVTSIGYMAFYYCTSLTSVVIGGSVTTIGSQAFWDCTSLISVVIGDSVTTIGSQAFYNCYSLTSVVIGDSVTSIGDWAFYNCDSLTSIEVGENNTAYKSIDGNLYSKDGTVLIQYAIGKTDSEFIIPDSVTSIRRYAFYNCDSLTSVYYKGTSSEWSSISIESFNEDLTNATRYYYVENEADVPTDGGNYWHYDENGNVAIW